MTYQTVKLAVFICISYPVTADFWIGVPILSVLIYLFYGQTMQNWLDSKLKGAK